mgnify:CR=1 FL=1
MSDMSAIMISLRPNNNWKIISNELIWKDDIALKPTDAEIEAKRIELENELPIKKLRGVRNKKLLETDMYAIPDFGHPSEEVKQAWLTYRQALRDLPANSTPSLDENGNLTNVTWPTSPS